jgi:hypothetical protein
LKNRICTQPIRPHTRRKGSLTSIGAYGPLLARCLQQSVSGLAANPRKHSGHLSFPFTSATRFSRYIPKSVLSACRL